MKEWKHSYTMTWTTFLLKLSHVKRKETKSRKHQLTRRILEKSDLKAQKGFERAKKCKNQKLQNLCWAQKVKDRNLNQRQLKDQVLLDLDQVRADMIFWLKYLKIVLPRHQNNNISGQNRRIKGSRIKSIILLILRILVGNDNCWNQN